MPTENRSPLLPNDEHDRRLLGHVHPANWQNPQPAARYNLVVVGAGTAGLVSAAIAAGLGARVALVERDLMGGDCLNMGCVPSKGMIRSARAAAAARHAADFGIQIAEDAAVDFTSVMQRMRRLRADIARHDSAARFRDLGVDVFLGSGQFRDPESISVDDHVLRFQRAVITTGARAAVPPIPGLDQVPYLTNENVFSLTELPTRLAVIGAGPIGCELAQTFARLGSQVTLIEATHGVMPREDRDAAVVVEAALKADGVTLLCCGKDVRVSENSDSIRVQLDSHEESYDVTVDKLLIAAGRAANVESLTLEAAGVAYELRRGVQVNDRLQTSNRHVFAAGDVCSPYQFTHAADFMARIVIQNALFYGRAKVNKLLIPWCTYTAPELAQVGLSEQTAAEQGIAIDTYVQPFDGVDRAILDGETTGFVKLHTKRGKDRILGGTIVAAHAGDLISQVTQAIQHRIGLKKISKTIHPYPTQADGIRKLGDAFNRGRMTPLAKALTQKWFAWRRGS